jgi:hypothetical protein
MYKITILKIVKVKRLEDPKWQVVDERLYTEQEATEASQRIYRDISPSETKKVYGYPPPNEVECEETHECFSQRVDDMNLAEVIKAVNGLP